MFMTWFFCSSVDFYEKLKALTLDTKKSLYVVCDTFFIVKQFGGWHGTYIYHYLHGVKTKKPLPPPLPAISFWQQKTGKWLVFLLPILYAPWALIWTGVPHWFIHSKVYNPSIIPPNQMHIYPIMLTPNKTTVAKYPPHPLWYAVGHILFLWKIVE